MPVSLISFLVFLINIPFGYWRSNQNTFSLKWFLAIHIPVVISILLRILFKIKFHWLYLLIFVIMFFAGQTCGKIAYTIKKSKTNV